jgi:hypothetical protein
MLLAQLFRAIFKRGELTVIDAKGQTRRYGDATRGPRVTIRLHDRALHIRLPLNPRLAIGEGYMDGTLTVEGGSIYDFLDLVGLNIGGELNTVARRNNPQHQNLNLDLNLDLNLILILALPMEVEHWSLTTLQEELVKIDAKVVSHGRYVTFQLAEVTAERWCDFHEFGVIWEMSDKLAALGPGADQLRGPCPMEEREDHEDDSAPTRERRRPTVNAEDRLAGGHRLR